MTIEFHIPCRLPKIDGAPGSTQPALGVRLQDDVHGRTNTASAGCAGIMRRRYDILALHLSNGKPVWNQYYWFSWVESPALVEDGVAYIGSSPAVGKKHVFVGALDGSIYAFELEPDAR